jgi:4-diphosphocytidyl-2C-methyl-D-erythritol kinase
VKRLCATVLIMEAIVVGLTIPVAVQIGHVAPSSAGLAGGTAAVAAVVLAALARRLLRVTLIAGTLLQAYVIALGAIVPVMYFLGGIFAVLWAVGIWLGYRFEHAAGH